LGNKAGLVADDIPSCVLLGSKNPLGTDNVGIRRGFGIRVERGDDQESRGTDLDKAQDVCSPMTKMMY